jgi:hypothetical protein
MCGTCHRSVDPDHPSTILYEFTPDRCGDCHGKVEAPSVDWVRDMQRRVRLEPLGGPFGPEEAVGPAFEALRAEIEDRGFLPPGDETPAFVVALRFETEGLRETGLLPDGHAVVQSRLTAVVRYGDTGEVVMRRVARSRPYFDRDARAARAEACRDALKVLMPHLLEALGSY